MRAVFAMLAAPRRMFPALLAIALLFALPDAARCEEFAFTVKSVPNVHVSDASRYTSNPHNILSPAAVAVIDKEAAVLNRELGVETAVVAVRNVGRNEPRMFAAALFNEWKLGTKGEDNGLLILLITEPPERSVIFETGYGLEAALPDVACYRLQQQHMIPALKNSDYDAGMVNGIRAVREFLTTGGAAGQAAAKAKTENGTNWAGGIGDFEMILGFLTLFILLMLAMYVAIQLANAPGRRSRGSSWGRDDDFRGGGGSGDSWGGGGSGSGSSGGGSWGGGGSGGGGSRSRF